MQPKLGDAVGGIGGGQAGTVKPIAGGCGQLEMMDAPFARTDTAYAPGADRSRGPVPPLAASIHAPSAVASVVAAAVVVLEIGVPAGVVTVQSKDVAPGTLVLRVTPAPGAHPVPVRTALVFPTVGQEHL
jgi:hypothetical protein